MNTNLNRERRLRRQAEAKGLRIEKKTKESNMGSSSIHCDYSYRSGRGYFIVLSYISILNMIIILILFVLGQNDKIARIRCSTRDLRRWVQPKSDANRYGLLPLNI